ncbi:hypothetical protein QQ008_07605 [Fulvivirgaceae bacterium BMA10]|uniref:DUF2283 domain-containing protein n=1 Tax=Splendidivirga corallicola TaxID=3051826 RepID=A0ABT8KKI1_9BACT|nr:hypothetical protein [Fulvivirgaceae bacterium BMA10]
MAEVVTKKRSNLFIDSDFQILHYWDNDDSIFVGFKKLEDGKSLTLSDVIESRVKPALQKILGHRIQGYFDPIYSFDMNERFVLLNLNGKDEIAVCNL